MDISRIVVTLRSETGDCPPRMEEMLDDLERTIEYKAKQIQNEFPEVFFTVEEEW